MTDEQLAQIRFELDTFHGEWNYTIHPRRMRLWQEGHPRSRSVISSQSLTLVTLQPHHGKYALRSIPDNPASCSSTKYTVAMRFR